MLASPQRLCGRGAQIIGPVICGRRRGDWRRSPGDGGCPPRAVVVETLPGWSNTSPETVLTGPPLGPLPGRWRVESSRPGRPAVSCNPRTPWPLWHIPTPVPSHSSLPEIREAFLKPSRSVRTAASPPLRWCPPTLDPAVPTNAGMVQFKTSSSAGSAATTASHHSRRSARRRQAQRPRQRGKARRAITRAFFEMLGNLLRRSSRRTRLRTAGSS